MAKDKTQWWISVRLDEPVCPTNADVLANWRPCTMGFFFKVY